MLCRPKISSTVLDNSTVVNSVSAFDCTVLLGKQMTVSFTTGEAAVNVWGPCLRCSKNTNVIIIIIQFCCFVMHLLNLYYNSIHLKNWLQIETVIESPRSHTVIHFAWDLLLRQMPLITAAFTSTVQLLDAHMCVCVQVFVWVLWGICMDIRVSISFRDKDESSSETSSGPGERSTVT